VVNVIKLFTDVIYKLSKKARVFVLGKLFQTILTHKHSRLVRKFVNYGRKRFITLAPGVELE
jgi:hypothetical protein